MAVARNPLPAVAEGVQCVDREIRALLERSGVGGVEELQVGRLGGELLDLLAAHRDAERAVRPVVRL